MVDIEKVLLEADGPVEGSTKKLDSGGNVIAPECARESVPEKPAGSPKITSGKNRRTTWSDSKDSKCRYCNSRNSVIRNRSSCGIRFKNQVTTCFDFPSDAMLWIKEVEMVGSLDELK